MRQHISRWHTWMTTVCLTVFVALLVGGCGLAGNAGPGARTLAAPGTYTQTYVAIGASDAFGIGTTDPDRQSWPTRLAGKLGGNVHLVNLGIPGATVEQAQRDEAPVALDAKPNVITVWLGTNDLAGGVALDTYSAQLRALLRDLRAGTHAHIFVGNLPDLTLLPSFARSDARALRGQIVAWNAAIASACAEAGATLVDLFAGWNELATHPEYISEDGFHPSIVGAERIAELFATTLRAHA